MKMRIPAIMLALLLMLTACAGPVIETTAPETSAATEASTVPTVPYEGGDEPHCGGGGEPG